MEIALSSTGSRGERVSTRLGLALASVSVVLAAVRRSGPASRRPALRTPIRIARRVSALISIGVLFAGCTNDAPSEEPSGPAYCRSWHPGHYVLPGTSTESEVEAILAEPGNHITGIQRQVSWREVEPQKDEYDFSKIEETLSLASAYGKQVFVQLTERSWNNQTIPVPQYILDDEVYDGGTVSWKDGSGSVARLWDPAVMERFDLVIVRMGKRFAADPSFEGINFPESALGIDFGSATGFSAEGLMTQLERRIDTAVAAFPGSIVIQYVNFGPDDMLKDLIAHSYEAGAGIGGPDLVPDEGFFASNIRIPAYDYYPEYAGRMPLVSAVQPPEFELDNKKGDFTLDGFWDMGLNTLRLDHIFWAMVEGAEYKFSFRDDILPYINDHGGEINDACSGSTRDTP